MERMIQIFGSPRELTHGAHLLMPVTRPLLNFATSRCGEIRSSWASEQLPQQRRALILTSRAKQFCFGRMHSTTLVVLLVVVASPTSTMGILYRYELVLCIRPKQNCLAREVKISARRC